MTKDVIVIIGNLLRLLLHDEKQLSGFSSLAVQEEEYPVLHSTKCLKSAHNKKHNNLTNMEVNKML